jgi:hypothetical protein
MGVNIKKEKEDENLKKKGERNKQIEINIWEKKDP